MPSGRGWRSGASQRLNPYEGSVVKRENLHVHCFVEYQHKRGFQVGTKLSDESAGGYTPQVSAQPAAAPNTYSDSRGTDPEESGGWPGHDHPGRSRCSWVPALPAIPGGWLIPRRDVPFVRARVRGRRRGLVPGGERGGGRVSVTGDCHSSFESPALPCELLGPVARPRARYHVPPSTPAAG